jgi:hypothetical protein
MDKIRSMSLATQSCADLTAARVRVSLSFPSPAILSAALYALCANLSKCRRRRWSRCGCVDGMRVGELTVPIARLSLHLVHLFLLPCFVFAPSFPPSLSCCAPSLRGTAERQSQFAGSLAPAKLDEGREGGLRVGHGCDNSSVSSPLPADSAANAQAARFAKVEIPWSKEISRARDFSIAAAETRWGMPQAPVSPSIHHKEPIPNVAVLLNILSPLAVPRPPNHCESVSAGADRIRCRAAALGQVAHSWRADAAVAVAVVSADPPIAASAGMAMIASGE